VLPLATAGCQAPVQLAAPTPATEVVDACEKLVADLPDKVLDEGHRKTVPTSLLTAAWGDPPIELVCGVAPPAGLAAAQSQCFEVNGVGWFAETADNGVVFTTIGRKLYVEVSVPNAYAPEANALTDLSGTMSRHNPVVTPCI
jgi:hypothetical protein